jgi:thiopeptide-type bacteriocin biosynthesis protein
MAFHEAGFFVLRTPLLPFDELGAFAGDGEAARVRLRALVARPEVREALFVASPSLDSDIDRYLREPTSERGLKVERSLVRYVCRMAGRSTPFGLFSGCSVGGLGEHSDLALDPSDRIHRHTRLDMYYVCELTDAIARAHRDEWTYRPSSSLYALAGQLRYAEAVSRAGAREYQLAAVERTPHLEATLARANDGATAAALAAALVADDPEIELATARAFVEQLIDAQLLVADLAPTVTGPESIAAVLAQLERRPSLDAVAAPLRAVTSALADLDARGLGHSPAVYRDLAGQLADLPVKPDLPRLFQVDLVKSSETATLGREVLAEIRRAVEVLYRLGPSRALDPMARFRAAFEARYQDRELPLAEVLDEDAGIGFEAGSGAAAEAPPLLRGFVFGGRGGGGGVEFTARDQLLLRKLEQVWRDGADELVLTDKDLAALETSDRAPLPDSFAVMAQLAASSPEALARGEFRVLFGQAGGPSAATLLGRFCHADPVLHARVLELLRAEEAMRPDAVFAEIVHLPEGRIGNIVSRPVLRYYEIAFLGESGAPRDRQLTLDDLTVRIERGRVVVRSQRLGREIIPRLTVAHNYHRRSLGVYRFLSALQRQGSMSAGIITSTSWSWGALGNAAQLPRVRNERTIFALRSWHWDAATVGVLKAVANAPAAAQRDAVARLRERDRLPRWIVIVEGDNTLPIDLDSELLVDALVQTAKTRDSLQLTELFTDEPCAHGREGRFVHELVIPYAIDTTPVQVVAATTFASAPVHVRPPGSDWLYAKLFAGPAATDRLLRTAIAPLVAELRGLGARWQWFFIRYGDPSWHVRLRVSGDPAWLHHEVVPRVHALAHRELSRGTISSYQLDTYDREVERYGGGEAIAIAEQLFCADADAVLALLPLVAGDPDLRWKLALVGMDRLFADLNYPLERRLAVVRGTRAGYGREFGASPAFDHQLGDRFRPERSGLEKLVAAATRSGDDPLAPAWHAFAARSARIAPLAPELAALDAAGRLTARLDDIVASYLHMYCNRLLRAAARQQELVLNDFLVRLYESQLARARKAPVASARG